MGWGLRKSSGSGPLRFTLSKSGISTRLGGKHGGVSLSKHGVTGSANSGVGLTYRKKLVGGASKADGGQLIEDRQTTGTPRIVVAALVGGLAYLLATLLGWF